MRYITSDACKYISLPTSSFRLNITLSLWRKQKEGGFEENEQTKLLKLHVLCIHFDGLIDVVARQLVTWRLCQINS